MRAAVYHSPDQPLALEEIPTPQPAPGNLLVRVRYCGICGTDLHASDTLGEMPGGLVLGHEYVGAVAAVGDGVDGWEIGDRVCSLPFIACGHCEACRAGRLFHCAGQQTTGLDRNGGFAEYVETAAASALRLPEGLSFERAVLIEPLAVGYHAIAAASLDDVDTALILGAGPIGLAVLYWCRRRGLKTLVVEKNPHRISLARDLGATAVTTPDDDVAEQLAAMADRPSIFECVGLPGMLARCIELAPVGGEIVVVGFSTVPEEFVPAAAMVKEVSLRFAIAYTRADFAAVIEVLAGSADDPTPMITGYASFDEFPAAFDALKRPSAQCKVVLRLQE